MLCASILDNRMINPSSPLIFKKLIIGYVKCRSDLLDLPFSCVLFDDLCPITRHKVKFAADATKSGINVRQKGLLFSKII